MSYPLNSQHLMNDLASYDFIVLNTSGGKDSQAMMEYVVGLARTAGVADRVVAVHCDLGPRVEWPGTHELVEEQCKHYSIRLEIISRPQGDLLAHVRQRGMWPSSTARYCTSDHKRGQAAKIITALTAERLDSLAGDRKVRILQCLGFRSAESAARAKKIVFQTDARLSNGKRHVDTWLPIHTWTTAQVWECIKASGVRHHYAYDKGMPRLSCMFCIFAPKDALVIAGRANPERLKEYVETEKAIGHSFRQGFKIAEVQEAIDTGYEPKAVPSWNM